MIPDTQTAPTAFFRGILAAVAIAVVVFWLPLVAWVVFK